MPVMELDQVIGLIAAKRMEKESKGRVLLAPRTTDAWPLNYQRVFAWRAKQLALLKSDPKALASAKAYYKLHPEQFVNHWCDTYDPRNANSSLPVYMPFVMFKRQAELMQFVYGCMETEAPGLVEKCRDMGATWDCIAISVHMWLFEPGSASGWGSATADKVDNIGDASSIFEKIRIMIRRLPDIFHPLGFEPKKDLMHKRIVNRETGSTITGEIGDNIGRGGRTKVYFVDEAAYIDRPESVDASLSENTRVRIDISSVSGLGTVFHRTRMAGIEWEPGQDIIKNRTNVFVMDWRHHPSKDQAWYDGRKQFWEAKGMPHVFAREIERNYSAAVQGVAIPSIYVNAAIDAHKKIPDFDDDGGHFAGLDVADGGNDVNALVRRKGWIIKSVDFWEVRDPGVTARRAVKGCNVPGGLPCELQYDCVGVGAGVKTETNRLLDEGLMPDGLAIIAWSGGFKVLNPSDNIVKGDAQSPTNKNYYANLKAQAWWELRLRFYRTWHMITTMGTADAVTYDPDDMISLDSASIGQTMLIKLTQELSQAVTKTDTKMRLLIDKSPDGVNSPNTADACVMCCWPLPVHMFGADGQFFGPIVVTG